MKSHRRTTIEKMLMAGKHTVAQLARMFHVTPQRVSQIKTELTKPTRAEVRELWNVDGVLGEQRTRVNQVTTLNVWGV